MSLVNEYDKTIRKKIGIMKFLSIFSDDNECLELVFHIKYNGHSCKKCGRSVTQNYKRIKRKDKNGNQDKSFRCKSCRTRIYPMAGSIFNQTSMAITDIFIMIFMFCNSHKSTSAIDITKLISISYKTAHKIMMSIRAVMIDDLGRKLKGNVEIDEVFIGKGSKYYNWSGISTRKQPILGMIERETKMAKVFLVNNRNKKTLRDLILNNVETDSEIYTDSWGGYFDLNIYYNHNVIDHTNREFVRGDIHTNTIENLWGGFKRNIRGAHIKISDKYVRLYMNELCWKHNHKSETEMKRFDSLLRLCFQVPAR